MHKYNKPGVNRCKYIKVTTTQCTHTLYYKTMMLHVHNINGLVTCHCVHVTPSSLIGNYNYGTTSIPLDSLYIL